jgi:hypothetical protein
MRGGRQPPPSLGAAAEARPLPMKALQKKEDGYVKVLLQSQR